MLARDDSERIDKTSRVLAQLSVRLKFLHVSTSMLAYKNGRVSGASALAERRYSNARLRALWHARRGVSSPIGGNNAA